MIANALHPSTYMNTTMVRRAGMSPMSKVETGAEAILQLAVSPKLEGKSGLYFNVHERGARQPAGLRRRGARASSGRSAWSSTGLKK